MSRLDQVKQLIDLNKVPNFIAQARTSASAVEEVYNSSMPSDEKLLKVFDVCVKYNLYDEINSG